eukprot:TRINITY_DN42285_c0_g2_i1.p1 TRINITY_DN42285_c0_g2~~TRINITY_DN42285_c0_g2_i1.p1  ORF type:complete len:436 (-),score=54.60 TRINITY_DN42285_c0_g2_i1:590-1897(-)
MAASDSASASLPSLLHSKIQPEARGNAEVFTAEVPNAQYGDTGALNETIKAVRKQISGPIEYADLHKQLKVLLPRGCLLFGSPGCGKTMLAKATAAECAYNVLSLKSPELLTVSPGESEQTLRQLFEKAVEISAGTVFFDSIESIIIKRDMLSEGGWRDRDFNKLLTEMDASSCSDVFVIGATSRQERLDPVLPGRLDKLKLVLLPDRGAWQTILERLMKTAARAVKLSDRVARRTDGFSVAELRKLYHAAVAGSTEGVIVALAGRPTDVKLEDSHFETAIQTCTPSVHAEELRLALRLGLDLGSGSARARLELRLGLRLERGLGFRIHLVLRLELGSRARARLQLSLELKLELGFALRRRLRLDFRAKLDLKGDTLKLVCECCVMWDTTKDDQGDTDHLSAVTSASEKAEDLTSGKTGDKGKSKAKSGSQEGVA